MGQLDVERGLLRHEIRLPAAGDLQQPIARQRAPGELLRDALHVQDADQLVQLPVVNGQAGVRGEPQLIENVVPVLADVDAGNLLSGNHDVVHRDLPEIENRKQHLPVTRGNQRTGFGHRRAQFLGAQCVAGPRGSADAEQH